MPSDFIGGIRYILENYSPLFIEGIKITLYISLTSTVIGCIVGLIVAVLRLLPINKKDFIVKKVLLRFFQFFLGFYVEFIRGTPMIVQAMFIYYGSKGIGMGWSVLSASIFIVSLNTGAYVAEIMRGGITSVDFGQTEGARAIGMTYIQSMIYVVIPQAFRNSLPAIGNEFVINIKDTSVLNVIALNELFLQAKTISGIHYRTSETFLITAIIYFIMTYTITRLLKYLEYRLDRVPEFSPKDGDINE